MRSAHTQSGSPIETQMSVYRTSAPFAPSSMDSVSVTEPLLWAAYCFAS